MPRFQTDDTFGDSLPAKRAGTAALGLYYLCGLWSARYLTDGHVPTEVAAGYGTSEWARKLVDAGLFVVEDGGYLMPLYLNDNPSAEKVMKERQAKADRQAKWLEKSRNASSKQRRVSSSSNRASKEASRDASGDAAPPLPSPKGEGVDAAPRSGGAAPPTHAPDPASAQNDQRPPVPGSLPTDEREALRAQLRRVAVGGPAHASAALNAPDGSTPAEAAEAVAEVALAQRDLAASGDAPLWRSRARRELAARGHVHPKADLVTLTAAELFRQDGRASGSEGEP